MIGAVAARATQRRGRRLWIWLITLWLSVPLGILSWAGIGLMVKLRLDCVHPRGKFMACSLWGMDISDWVNGLRFGGYAMTHYGIPWFVIGGVCVAIALVIRALRS